MQTPRVTSTWGGLITRLLIFVPSIFLISLPARVQPRHLISIERDLPRHYIGDFRWQAGGARQKVELKFMSLARVDAESLEARGCGRYDASGVITDIKVKLLISEPTLAVELFEQEPIGSEDFTVDGSHIGSLSDDLRHLVAVWTTRATSATGRLDLYAGGNLDCSDVVAFTTRTDRRAAASR